MLLARILLPDPHVSNYQYYLGAQTYCLYRPVTSAHTGAGLAAAVLDSTNPGRIFYENGTHAQVTAYQTTILTDGGTPPAPYGLTVPAPGSQPLPGQEVIGINVGPGTFNTIVSKRGKGPVVVNRLDEGKGTFVACKGEIPYYPGLEFVKVQYVYAGEKLGEGCVGIELVPECAELNELPEGSYSSHEFAVEVKCFDNN